MHWRVPLADVDLGPEEEAAVLDVLQGRWLTMGAITQAFEEQFAAYMGVSHAIAVTNGTAALHLACLVLGLGLGDEVIVPALTFVATAAAPRYTGATPVFADIESENDLSISPGDIERRVTKRTRAIIVMHYGGYSCDMPAIMALARRRGLAVIEDAAHAPGAELHNRKLGTWGDVGCFSFFSNKNMITGEGGMLTTNDAGIAKELRRLRSHAMTHLSWDRYRGHAWSYDVVALGYNYRIDEIRAALGQVQLGKLDENNEKRRAISDLYRQRLEESSPEVKVPFHMHPGISACHIMPVLLPMGGDRTRFMELMKEQGIQTSIHYPPIHLFQYYMTGSADGPPVSLPVTEELAAREVTLPLYPTLNSAHFEMVVEAVRNALGDARKDR